MKRYESEGDNNNNSSNEEDVPSHILGSNALVLTDVPSRACTLLSRLPLAVVNPINGPVHFIRTLLRCAMQKRSRMNSLQRGRVDLLGGGLRARVRRLRSSMCV